MTLVRTPFVKVALFLALGTTPSLALAAPHEAAPGAPRVSRVNEGVRPAAENAKAARTPRVKVETKGATTTKANTRFASAKKTSAPAADDAAAEKAAIKELGYTPRVQRETPRTPAELKGWRSKEGLTYEALDASNKQFREEYASLVSSESALRKERDSANDKAYFISSRIQETAGINEPVPFPNPKNAVEVLANSRQTGAALDTGNSDPRVVAFRAAADEANKKLKVVMNRKDEVSHILGRQFDEMRDARWF